ncbi:MAG TPA: DUF6350 family protein [Streptosporangiaceae bacterium]
MTGSVLRTRSPAPPAGGGQPLSGSPLAVRGAVAAGAVAGIGLVILVLLVVVGWVAAPHDGLGLTGVLRTAATAWLIGNHVGFVLTGTGPVGMLPLGLVLLPGALLWRAGRWVVRTGGVTRLRHVGSAALAVAVPYATLSVALAAAGRSAQAAPSILQAAACGFLLALTAAGLGGARALAPWSQLTGLMPARLRAVVTGAAGALAVLAGAGALLAGGSLAAHLGQYAAINRALSPGLIGAGLLILAQVGYVPNAIVWAIAFTLGPGFAFGNGTVIAPGGSMLGPLPEFPMLAALPAGPHPAVPAALSVAMLAVPYLAGAFGGLLIARAAPTPVLEAAPLWGFGAGALAGCVLAVLAWFAGGPLGNGRLAAVGPSPWQTGVVAVLEVGVAAAISAGVANWLRYRGTRLGVTRFDGLLQATGLLRASQPPDEDEHTIYLNQWDEPGPGDDGPPAGYGPASLP